MKQIQNGPLNLQNISVPTGRADNFGLCVPSRRMRVRSISECWSTFLMVKAFPIFGTGIRVLKARFYMVEAPFRVSQARFRALECVSKFYERCKHS